MSLKQICHAGFGKSIQAGSVGFAVYLVVSATGIPTPYRFSMYFQCLFGFRKKRDFQIYFLAFLNSIFHPNLFVRDPEGPLGSFRASRVPLGIGPVESRAVEHSEIA